ncbi:restriction endonuclease subunit S [Lactococcus formosensis subsp. bovis]|uniref:restriction endonuclease subunit S n=2 Tax=Lactococcus formosensis TaxID=1281486 RepID=UPI003852A98E
MSKKSPQLRFEGFTDDWEERKLGDVFYERSERSSEGELISVTINSGVVKASELDRKDNSSNDKSNYKKVEVGDIAYNSMRMWQGASGCSSYDGILSPAYTVIIPKEGTDSKFFAYDFKRHDMIQTFKRNSQGLTSDTWNLKFPTLKSVKVMVPCMEEQTKISNFFERLDTTITLHQRKLDLLKEQKKGYLQKMFPKNGAKVPELRFAGFADDWEDRKLGEISKYSNGGSYENDVVENGTYELITLKSVNMSGKLVSSGKFINRETKTLEKDTLVMILSEQAPGLLGMTAQIPENNKYVLNQRVAEIKPNTNIDSYFLSMSINRSQVYFSKRGAGTKVQNISKPNVENFEFYCPSEREQQKIGSFFKQVDNTIDLHQHKLDLLKEQKKGFLQKMFV